ncbi:MAG: transposase [Gammaproteobacteria bacterium]|nr:transposase [Gammaproteobacteria bacterium]
MWFRKKVGKTDTGVLYEQWIKIIDEAGKRRKYRQVQVYLNTATRDGEKDIAILTNLPRALTSAKFIAERYRKRWRIESMFQELEAHLHSES